VRLFYAKSDQKPLNQNKIHEKSGLSKWSNRCRDPGRGRRSFYSRVFQQNLPFAASRHWYPGVRFTP